MREPIVTADPEVGTILLTQEAGGFGGERQGIEVTAAMVPRLISQLFTAAVCIGGGLSFPLPEVIDKKGMN